MGAPCLCLGKLIAPKEEGQGTGAVHPAAENGPGMSNWHTWIGDKSPLRHLCGQGGGGLSPRWQAQMRGREEEHAITSTDDKKSE